MMNDPTDPLLVVINPASGTRIALKMFNEVLKPSLEKNQIEYELLKTQYAGHAKDVVQQKNLKEYSGLIIISGDGLVHEVFNGLYALPDWMTIMKYVPFGLMPGGSGNALNCSLLHQMKQPFDGMNKLGTNGALENIMNGVQKQKTTGLDFLEVETDGKKMLCFLGVTIGLIADVDLGSEFLRFMGYIRAYLLCVWKIIKPKYYRLKVSYLPLPLDTDGKPIPVSSDAQALELPGLDQPHPNDWVSEEGKYVLVYATKCPLLDPITVIAPDCTLDDGILWLVIIESSFTRRDALHWLLNSNDAAHIGRTGVRLVPVRAFRFEPIRPQGLLSIDAEKYKFGPVQGQILPSKVNLMSAK